MAYLFPKYLLTSLTLGLIGCLAVSCNFTNTSEVDFNTDVRPILNKNCMSCHGGVRQKGGLSFLFRQSALDTLNSGNFAIVPGSANKSVVIERISEQDPELRMPPEGAGLSPEEIEILTRWIKQGAEWDDHWAYVSPDPEIEPPEVQGWQQLDGIDRFVLDKLTEENLQLSDQADDHTLLRRVSLDLIGLPPPKQLAESFIADPSSEAYQQLVDGLLASEHYGEKWASFWLDLARYADSQGYQKDNLRPTMWMYRDWVIDAFNKDMPFDQFTIEQLAGDLLPEPSDNQILATAFHRNTMNNDEGGTDDEEFRVAAVLDRVSTTFEVWQGTTLSCVQCHTHPYDPIKHEEYYNVYAYFNNTRDNDLTNDEPNAKLLSGPQKTLKADFGIQIKQFKADEDTVSKAYRTAVNSYMNIRPVKVPIMKELSSDSSRTSHVFVRGNWLVHGEKVEPAVPRALNNSTANPSNRLELAEWLTDSENPLTARVVVNRFWEQLFGLGLVETLEDFGSQGSPPVHPELLDWLAVQLAQKHNWSVKSMLKQMVMSATYRQSSKVNPQLLELDPYNKLLARGPRVRLSAEQIRDQALAVSGLLNNRVYGPSVMPPQPEGVWNVIRHVGGGWKTSIQPKDQNRRALYTFWRRVSPYPSMVSFDATSREFCVSRRIRTNTPLQAFVTLNDPVFFVAAQSLATKMYEESEDLAGQIRFGFQQTLFRDPTTNELETLQSLFGKSLALYQEQPGQIPKITNDLDHQTPSMAALINLASAILNLDETITKG